MRTIFSTLTLGLLISACGGGGDAVPVQAAPGPSASAPVAESKPAPAEAPPPAKPPLADLEQASLKAYVAGFTDAKAIAALYAPDATLTIAGTPPLTGREAILAFIQGFLDSQSNVKFGVSRVWMSGKTVACEWMINGTQSKDWNGLPGNGKAWGVTGGSVLTYNEDGLIVQDDRYLDFGTEVAQLGLSKQKVRPVPAIPTAVEAHAAKGAPEEDKNVALAKAGNRTWETHDSKAFLGFLNDDVTYDDMTMPSQLKTKAPAKAIIEAFGKAFPDLKITETSIWGADDYTIDEYTMDGTQKAPLKMGPGMTIPNTKKTIDAHTLEILQWKDGKVAHGWAYSNGAEFMTQLGLAPPPGAKPPSKK
jgi:steroid delta-isomerase-like uncharacterized protein